MFFVRQGATHKLLIGPVVAVANGYVPVTTLDLSTADEKAAILHDNGTVVSISAYTFAAVTSADGYYHLTLQSGITNTVGHVTIVINDDSLCLPVKAEYTVIDTVAYDALFADGATGAFTGVALAADQAVNATKLAGQTITAAAGVTFPTSVASPTNITAGTITTVTTLTNLPAITSNWLTAAGIAAGALDGKGNWNIGKTGYALTATTGLGNQTANITGTITTATSVTNQLTAAQIATGVWQDATAGDFTTASSIGKALYVANVVPGAAGGHFIAGTNAATSITTALTANITGNLSGSVGSVTGAVGSVTGAVGSVTGAVGSVTGNVGGNVTGSVGSVTGNVGGNVIGSVASVTALTTANIADAVWDETIAGHAAAGSTGEALAGATAPSAASVADAVWDEVLSGHLTAGTTGNALNAAGSAGDPWSTALPGAYGAGTAGKLIGDNVNATISSRATQTSVDTIDGIVDSILVDTAEIGTAGAGLTALATAANLATVAGYLDTEIAAILADTNELQTDWANGGRLDLILDARASQTSVDDVPTNAELATALGTADDAVLAQVALVKAKTDLIPAAPAAVGDIPTATANADALLNRDMSAVSDTNARSPLNALRFLRNKWSISGTTLTVTKEDDSASAWTSTVATTPGADPVTGNDPA